MSNIIGELKGLIKERGLSVLQIAKKTDIPAYRIYKWVAGKAKPKHEDVQILEKYLSECLEEKQSNGKQEPKTEKPEETEPLLSELIRQQNRLNELQAKVMDEKMESMLKTVKDTNQIVSRLIHALQATKLSLDSASHVVLKSLARIEKKAQDSLLKEADKITSDRIREKKKEGRIPTSDN